MTDRRSDYFVFPSVVRADAVSEIEIIPRGAHAEFIENAEYTITFVPMERFNVAYEISRFEANFDVLTVRSRQGKLRFTYRFCHEQEWSVIVSPKDAPDQKKVFHIYAAADDLYGKTPYRGDLHVHSHRSDGNESPAVVAANYRKGGFDFMAITDHHRYAPSLEAIGVYKDVPIQLKLFPGEEVHVPGNYIHMVNFGGSQSVNELYEQNKVVCDKEIAELAETLNVTGGVNTLEFAYRKWTVEKIREGGGIAILVHPFWIYQNEYNMQTHMTKYMFRSGCFDAFELLSGLSDKENNLQLALYADMLCENISIPIVGSSDSHGTEPPVYFKSVYTVILADELTLDGIKSAIYGFNSAAVGATDGCPVRVHGTLRTVKYVQFLLENYFPRHDELCAEEGLLMKDYACGDKSAKNALAALSHRVEDYRAKFFGRAL